MSPITTLAPSATSRRAWDAPIPRAPPLIRATFAATRPMSGHATRRTGAARTCSNTYSEVSAVAPLLTACSGFLLAVLWMDLIFDVQVLRTPKRGCGIARARARLHRRLLPPRDHHIATDEPTDRPRHVDLVGRVRVSGRSRPRPRVAAGRHRPGSRAVPMVLALTHTVPAPFGSDTAPTIRPNRPAWRDRSAGITSSAPAACWRSWSCGLAHAVAI